MTAETNAEQLEIAKDRFDRRLANTSDCLSHEEKLFLGSVWWLIGRVCELESFVRDLAGEETLYQQGDYETEMRRLNRENARLRENIIEITDCVDIFYNNETPRRLNYELQGYAGVISTIDKIASNALKGE